MEWSHLLLIFAILFVWRAAVLGIDALNAKRDAAYRKEMDAKWEAWKRKRGNA